MDSTTQQLSTLVRCSTKFLCRAFETRTHTVRVWFKILLKTIVTRAQWQLVGEWLVSLTIVYTTCPIESLTLTTFHASLSPLLLSYSWLKRALTNDVQHKTGPQEGSIGWQIPALCKLDTTNQQLSTLVHFSTEFLRRAFQTRTHTVRVWCILLLKTLVTRPRWQLDDSSRAAIVGKWLVSLSGQCEYGFGRLYAGIWLSSVRVWRVAEGFPVLIMQLCCALCLNVAEYTTSIVGWLVPRP